VNSAHSFWGYNTLFQSAAIRLTALVDDTHTHTHTHTHSLKLFTTFGLSL